MYIWLEWVKVSIGDCSLCMLDLWSGQGTQRVDHWLVQFKKLFQEYFRPRTAIQFRNSRWTKFLWDKWVGKNRLKEAFPVQTSFYSFGFMGRRRKGRPLISTIQKTLQDWEIGVVTQFMELIYSMRVQEDGEDSLPWKHNKRGRFNAKL